MLYRTVLNVNEREISLNEYARKYLTNVVICAVSMLKGGQNVVTLHYVINSGESNLIINDQKIEMIPFLTNALKGIVSGITAALKGVEEIDTLTLDIYKLE